MDIVPKDETLLVDARISPDDIDLVSPGQPAQVRLTALSQRHQTPFEGRLISVSADSLTDERTGQPFYLGRVEFLAMGAAGKTALHPGMQAQVFVYTGRSTLLDYLLAPLMRTLEQGFREL